MHDIYNIVKNDVKKVEKEFINLFENTNDIYYELNSFLNSSSKRIRSILGILYLKSQGIEIDNDIITVLSSGEILHNASLLHDDVIDDALIRRNETTLSKKYSSKISILSGDLLVSCGIKKLLKLNNNEINNIFLECTEKMSRAEIEQYILRNKVPDINQYLTISKGKTASLFIAILKSVSILTKLDIKQAELFGELFGLAFQIQNDLEPKSANSDFKNGIYTIKDIIGIEKLVILVDNYNKEMKKIIFNFPKNVYKKSLEDLIDKVCLIRTNLKQD